MDYLKSLSSFTEKFKITNKIAKRIVEGYANATGTKVSEDIAATRIAACEDCQYFDKTYRKCIACLCFMDIKTKFDTISSPTGIKKIECPDNRW